MIEHKDKHGNENMIEGRNAVLEAFRSGKTIDKLYVLDGCQDGPVRSITREAARMARCGRLYVRQRSMILWFSL